MEIKNANRKENVKVKEYSANQSVKVRNEPQGTDVQKGHSAQMTTQVRNEPSTTEGYNAQQMVQTANNQQPTQQSQQTKKTESSDDKK